MAKALLAAEVSVAVVIIGLGVYLAAMGGVTSNAPVSSTSPSVASPISRQADSFTVQAGSPISVEAVWANFTSEGYPGEDLVTFFVTYQNAGSVPLRYTGGCGSSLSVTVLPGSGNLQQVTTNPPCECGEVSLPLAPGKDTTASAPGCWDGYLVRVTGFGSASVLLTIDWGGSGSGTTNVTARFTLY